MSGRPTGRYRVGFQTVMGQDWYDVYSYREALQRASIERRRGARDVQVLREYESDNRFTADFRKVWP